MIPQSACGRFAMAVAVVLTVTVGARAEPPLLEASVDGVVEELYGLRFDSNDFAAEGPLFLATEFSRIGSKYMRLHLIVEGAETTPGAVIEIAAPFEQHLRYSVEEIGSGLWTGMLPLGLAEIQLKAPVRPDGLALIIDKVTVPSDKAVLFSIYGENDLISVNDASVPPHVRSAAGPVAFLSFLADGIPRRCTGFLIASDILMTNEHCINSVETCRSLSAAFGYEQKADGGLLFGRQSRCAGFELMQTQWPLDVSLVKLTHPPGPTFGVARLAETEPLADAPLFIIQHPGDYPKQVSLADCKVMVVPVDGRGKRTDFTHSCDTAEGSSGSPVFTSDGTVVGLHHFGFSDSPGGDWTENRAVRLACVRHWLTNSAKIGEGAHDAAALTPDFDCPLSQ